MVCVIEKITDQTYSLDEIVMKRRSIYIPVQEVFGIMGLYGYLKSASSLSDEATVDDLQNYMFDYLKDVFNLSNDATMDDLQNYILNYLRDLFKRSDA